ncbi:MAG TPA: BsaA family SipW-dependent biofilm matrix protein [Bacillota bacterium]|nr:BsaA family SipW-dependent biofilm matrix protein [Bacillota bacterium]
MKRSIPIGLLVVSLVALFVLGGTLAWFTADAKAPNMFTTGTVDIEIDEDLDDPNDWAPGITKKKEVSVKNLGSLPVFVRVQLTPVWGSMDGEDFREDEELSIDNVIFNVNTEDWVKSGDWYYYKGVLEPEGETPLLLSDVTLDSSLTGNAYQGKTLKIYVNAEAVQAAPINAALDAWDLEELPFELE